MGQTTDNNDKAQTVVMISNINRVEGFDPTYLAVDYTDPNGQTYKRLPALSQMAWFRLKYPEGKIALSNIIEKLLPSGELVYTVTARVYADYRLDVNCFLAEGTATRGQCKDKPSVSPKEWAQTAAIGIALRNAGFGLQFNIAGEDFPAEAPNELGGTVIGSQNIQESFSSAQNPVPQPVYAPVNEGYMPPVNNVNGADMPMGGGQVMQNSTRQNVSQAPDGNVSMMPVAQQNNVPPREMTYEEKLNAAMNMPCPINKYKGYSLGQVLSMDASAINWIATKSTLDNSIKAAAMIICEHAMQQQASA